MHIPTAIIYAVIYCIYQWFCIYQWHIQVLTLKKVSIVKNRENFGNLTSVYANRVGICKIFKCAKTPENHYRSVRIALKGSQMVPKSEPPWSIMDFVFTTNVGICKPTE